MKSIILTAVVMLFVSTAAMAQKGVDIGTRYGKGEDSIRCLTNLSLYAEYYKQKNYKDAFPYWEIAFNECPLATLNLYSNGAVMMKSFIETETDAKKKDDWFQYLMKVYDQRIKYFGNHAKYPTDYINGIKGIDMLRYKANDQTYMKSANALLQTTIKNRGNKTQAAVLTNYMTNTVSLFKAAQLTAADVVDAFTVVSEILDYQTSNTTDETDEGSNLPEIKAAVEKLFASSGAASCDVIAQIFTPQFDANKENLAWLKRVSSLLNRQECENDLVFKVSESLHKLEPSASSARGMAVMCLKNKETDRAIEYYKEAINLETNDESKGTLNYQLGMVYMSNDNYGAARTQFQRAIELRPGWGNPHMQIGVLYALSANRCGTNEFEHKAVYWVAVDKFIRAKTVDPSITEEANKMIGTYSAHFPGKEELFFQGINEGASYTVGCWIGESTSARSKR